MARTDCHPETKSGGRSLPACCATGTTQGLAEHACTQRLAMIATREAALAYEGDVDQESGQHVSKPGSCAATCFNALGRKGICGLCAVRWLTSTSSPPNCRQRERGREARAEAEAGRYR